jgi:predicted nucleic acid-binding protein
VDTSGFLGLLVAEDASHDNAWTLFKRANEEHWRLVTTNAVVIESYSLFLVRTRDRRRSAIAFLDALDRDGIRVERILRQDEEKAIALVRDHEDKTYSLCDALSFVVMERLGISEAIAFDRHFREYVSTFFARGSPVGTI